MSLRGLLFDLDGTLADTAPDLVGVLNRLLADDGRPPIPFAVARNVVSHGAIGLIRLGFGLPADAPVDQSLRQRFLDLYVQYGHMNSRLFITLETIIDLCSQHGARWGIVTNKPENLTVPLLDCLGVRASASTIVSGDTLPRKKPDPAPLLLAARELDTDPTDCVYIGDAERDIVAGRAAGMLTVATGYGYIRPHEDVAAWRADAIADHPRRIGPMLRKLAGIDAHA